jgi:hypothetical protein
VGSPHITKNVIKYLGEHAGKTVLLSDLVAHLEASEGSIRGSINRAIQAGLPIEVMVRSNAWRYNSDAVAEATPEPKPNLTTVPTETAKPVVTIPRRKTGNEIAEPITIVGTTRAKETIVRDGNGYLFILKPM